MNDQKQLEKKHPLAIRWLHWINFPLLTLMIWSGLLIYWANPVYSINFNGHQIFHFFPQRFFSALHIPFHLADGIMLHFFFMWFFAINGALYFLYLIFSGAWRALVPVPGSFKRALQVTLYDFYLAKKIPPQGKYNDAQRIAYTGVVLMGFASIITGLGICKPLQLSWLTTLLGGYSWAREEHFILTVGFVLFFLVHVFQVIRAGWSNFRSMVTGYEVIHLETTAAPPAPGADRSS